MINKALPVVPNRFPPTFQLPQFSLGQNSAPALIFELRLQLLDFHEQTDGVRSDVWACDVFFVKVNVFMLLKKNNREEIPLEATMCCCCCTIAREDAHSSPGCRGKGSSCTPPPACTSPPRHRSQTPGRRWRFSAS